MGRIVFVDTGAKCLIHVLNVSPKHRRKGIGSCLVQTVVSLAVNKSSNMNTRQKLELIIDQLNNEQLSTLLDFAVLLKSKEKATVPMIQSQAYEEWLSSENDIYDELFTDELSTR